MGVFLDVEKFYEKFKGKKEIIGRSLFNKPIYSICVHKTARPLIIAQYSIHAREYITSYLALKQILEYKRKAKIGTVCFIPLLNPDGVEICEKQKPLYKANGRGVDLNVNFDANWGTGESNVKVKSDQNYIGTRPFSEPESEALRCYTETLRPDMTISYHSKGRELYWYFGQGGDRLERDFYLATVYALCSGYKVMRTPNSAGGYKDWCVQKLKIPSLTVEVGDDNLTHPIQKKEIKQIYNENKYALIRVVEALAEKRWKSNL